MARSLTVSHEETLTVNWLFSGFLLVAVGWLMLSTLGATNEADAAAIDAASVPASNMEEIALSQE